MCTDFRAAHVLDVNVTAASFATSHHLPTSTFNNWLARWPNGADQTGIQRRPTWYFISARI